MPELTIPIPAQPEVLKEIATLLASGEADSTRIATLIKEDVALYTLILKSVNSPYYGLRVQVTSIEHAINLLGMQQVFNLVRLTLMRNTLKQLGRMDRFWDTAKDVSLLSSRVAAHLRTGLNKDDIYTLGMLHDCGLPVMLQAFKGFRTFLAQASHLNCAQLEQQELQKFGFSHYQIGARMAERWNLPQTICDAIKYQPQAEALLSDQLAGDEQTRHLIAVLMLAQNISAEFRYYWRIQPSQELDELKPALHFLGISDYDYLCLRDSLLDDLVS